MHLFKECVSVLVFKENADTVYAGQECVCVCVCVCGEKQRCSVQFCFDSEVSVTPQALRDKGFV